jgi:ribosomal protein S6 kinase alpha-5
VLTYELLTGASPFTVEGESNSQKDISKRILTTSPPMTMMDGDVRDFILKLLVRDPNRRLGGNNPDAYEIKQHPFFQEIDWDLLAKKQIPAPFKPHIAHDLDTSNFSDEFTQLPVTDSPSTVPPNSERLFRGKFTLFSFSFL